MAGAYRGEFEQMNAWDEKLGHDARYDLTEEWTTIIKRLWQEKRVDFAGKYFTIKDCVSEPKPLRPPELICAGMSARGFEFSVRHADICFIGGRNEAETRAAALRAKELAASLGKTFFASTILLLDYFGRSPNLELFSIVNLISTVGSVGPAFGGYVADRTGSFVPAFAILAGLVFLVLLAVLWMKPPHRMAA